MLSQVLLKQHLCYIPETGTFIRLTGEHKGKVVYPRGSLPEYLVAKVETITYRLHNLAWLYVYGYLPTLLDHKDADRYNNKISNLRECTVTENNRNQRLQSNNTTGYKGISLSREKGCRIYRARVGSSTKAFSIKHDRTQEQALEQAIAWTVSTRNLLHGEFANHGGTT